MRDEGHYLDGREMKFPPKYFLGAAASPFASEPRFQAIREHKKVNAGAQFFQTNLVFDPDGFEMWLDALAQRNILDKVYILVGITPLKNLKMALYMDQEVPGVFIPQTLIKRLEVCRRWSRRRRRANCTGNNRGGERQARRQRDPPDGCWVGGDCAAHHH